MSQHLSMLPSQIMRLEQRLTPQLIQSMEILQLPLMALEARVRQELESNPMLEDVETHLAEPAAEPDASAESQQPETSPEAESFERLDRLTREYDFDPGDQPYARRTAGDGERDAKMDAMANSAARGVSLGEYLERQWALMDLSPEVRNAGLVVIGWLDPDGYLRTRSEQNKTQEGVADNGHLPLVIRRDVEGLEQLDDEIAHSVDPPIDAGVLEEAIARVQTLDPRGVGARDLTECLMIQLDTLQDHHLEPGVTELAELLVENHLIDLVKNRFPVIVRQTGHTIDEIKTAQAVIARLHHHPGLAISPVEAPRVTPDILVDFAEDGDGYTVRLARGNTPRLRLSHQYQQMLQDRHADKDTREFLRRNLESAKALIDAIQFRKARLVEIAKIVVERQREFLDLGPQHLKILRMRDIAEELGCDPSTISRTVDGKYLQTPSGIYPLRLFFTGGTETTQGEAISWDAVKLKVKEIIDQEDKSDPMSDDAIVKTLAEGGHVNLSRRTVAKYRAQLGIPPARQRRQF